MNLRWGVYLMLITLLVLPEAWAGYERRTEALQLYQEGLFQETGTGDLKLAREIYQSLTENFRDYRDIAAVAYYHLGLIYEKWGNNDVALGYYRLIVTHYSEQEKVLKNAAIKIKTLPKAMPFPEPQLGSMPKPTETPIPVAVNPLPISPPVKLNALALHLRTKNRLGVGATNFGAHVRYLIDRRVCLEARALSASTETMVGVRAAILSDPPVANLPFIAYTGMEVDSLYYEGTSSGFTAGGFVGIEWLALRNLGVNTDIGYYYVQHNHENDPAIRTKLRWTIAVTRYF